MTYLDEPERVEVVLAHVRHELKKARSLNDESRSEAIGKVRRRIGDDFAGLFQRAVNPTYPADDFIKALRTDELWKLFHALSYGWQEKALWNCVGEPQFRWVLEDVDPYVCDLDSPGEWLHARKDQRGYVSVADALEEAVGLVQQGQVASLRSMIQQYENQSHEAREEDPLIGRRRPRELTLIHDGNGRLQVWVAKLALDLPHPGRVRVWVGHEGGRSPSSDDLHMRAEAKRSLFPTPPSAGM